MTFSDGEYVNESKEQLLDAMVANAKEYWGEDLKDDELATIRLFYEPIAKEFSNAQDDIGLVLQSSQIDNATGKQLDLLTALIGVGRDPATYASGQIMLYRSDLAGTDYTIPSGTVVQTDSNEPTKYETTETVTILEGSDSVIAPIKAVDSGVNYNTGSNTITIIPNPPAGVENVTNSSSVSGGTNIEDDDSLRSRAKKGLSEGSRASAQALIYGAKSLDGVKSVTIFLNDTNQDNTGSGGLPDHSFELVVLGGNRQEIGQMILETKAAGDTSWGGTHGTNVDVQADLSNGQQISISYSEPNEKTIYIDVDLVKTDEFLGVETIRDSIVNYIGGLTTGNNEDVGELYTGDNVIYGKVEYAIRDVDGVYDINSLTIGLSDDPTGTSDVTIADDEVANTDGTDTSIIGVTTNDLNV